MLALFIKTILFRHFIFVSYLNDFNQFLNITERRGDLKGLVKLAYTLCEAHILHFLKQLADYLSVDRSAMSNELCKLRDAGILEFNKNTFTIFEKND